MHPLNENKDEDTDELVVKHSKFHMKIYIKLEQIERTNIIHSFKIDGNNGKCRPIIIKFVQYSNRHNTFSKKNKKLHASNIPITLKCQNLY